MTDELLAINAADEVRRKALANLVAMGFDGEEVEVLHANVKALRDAGMLLDLDINGLTMFEARTSWQLDMGVPAKDARRVTKRLRIGRKNLLPNTKLQSVAQRIRDNLIRYSQAIAVFPGYRYVPYGAFLTWWERHQELLEEWDDHKSWILNEYEALRAECRADYTKHARDTWASTPSIQTHYDQATFVNLVVADAISHFPSKAKIESDLQVSLKPPATFLLESEYQAELLKAQRISEKRRDEYEKERLQRDTWAREQKARAERAEAEARAAGDLAQAASIEAAERERVAKFQADEEVRAIRQAQIEIAREVVKDTVNPLVQIVEENRKRIYQTLTGLQTNITRRGWVHGKEANAIRSLHEWFKLMNITDDQEMEQRLQALSDSLGVLETNGSNKYDADGVLASMRSAIGTALTDAAGVAATLEIDAMSQMDI